MLGEYFISAVGEFPKTNWNSILVSTHLDRIVLSVLLLFQQKRCVPLTSPLANAAPPRNWSGAVET